MNCDDAWSYSPLQCSRVQVLLLRQDCSAVSLDFELCQLVTHCLSSGHPRSVTSAALLMRTSKVPPVTLATCAAASYVPRMSKIHDASPDTQTDLQSCCFSYISGNDMDVLATFLEGGKSIHGARAADERKDNIVCFRTLKPTSIRKTTIYRMCSDTHKLLHEFELCQKYKFQAQREKITHLLQYHDLHQ